MSNSFYRSRYRFLIYNTSLCKGDIPSIPLLNHTFHNLTLYLPHHLGMYLSALWIPHNTQQRFFLFQFLHFNKRLLRVNLIFKHDPVVQHRFQYWHIRCLFFPQSLTGKSSGQPGYCANHPRLYFLYRFKPGTRIQTNLIHFFLFPSAVGAMHRRGTFHIYCLFFSFIRIQTKQVSYSEYPSSYLQVRQTVSFLISANFINPRRKSVRVTGRIHITAHSLQKFLHSLQFQGRTKITGKHFPPLNHAANFLLCQFSPFQKYLHSCFGTKCQLLKKGVWVGIF